jgi:methylmalonyl-CoA mutase N-terminal domain/subunit
MQILIEEMGLCDTVDPLAGSFYIESLTNRLEEKIIECMKKVEERGGIVKAVSNGYIQGEVARQAYAYEMKIQSGEIVKVGVNKYRIDEEERSIEFHEYNENAMNEQTKRLKKVKKERDNSEVKKTLNKLRDAAKSNENLMPFIIDTVKCYSTVGEITGVLKEIFGEFKEPVSV